MHISLFAEGLCLPSSAIKTNNLMGKYILWAGIAGALLLSACGKKKPSTDDYTVRVKVMEVGAVQVKGEQGFSGTVEERSGVSLSFATSGTIRSIMVDEGQMVKAGQLIAVLDGADQAHTLAASEATTQQARDALAQAQDNYNRMKQLHDAGSLPDARWVEAQTQLAEARSALKSAESLEKISRKNSSDTRLTAPFSGYVAKKSADTGQNILAGVQVVRLVRIDRVKVKISVPEEEIGKIHKGEAMMITCAAAGDKVFTGNVIEKGVDADPLSRTYTVKAEVDNPTHELLPGMICQVYTHFTKGEQGIFVPANVVQLNPDNKTFVWVLENGRAERRDINVVSVTSQGVKVDGSLKPGDDLIIEGQQKVSDSTRCIVVAK